MSIVIEHRQNPWIRGLSAAVAGYGAAYRDTRAQEAQMESRANAALTQSLGQALSNFGTGLGQNIRFAQGMEHDLARLALAQQGRMALQQDRQAFQQGQTQQYYQNRMNAAGLPTYQQYQDELGQSVPFDQYASHLFQTELSQQQQQQQADFAFQMATAPQQAIMEAQTALQIAQAYGEPMAIAQAQSQLAQLQNYQRGYQVQAQIGQTTEQLMPQLISGSYPVHELDPDQQRTIQEAQAVKRELDTMTFSPQDAELMRLEVAQRIRPVAQEIATRMITTAPPPQWQQDLASTGQSRIGGPNSRTYMMANGDGTHRPVDVKFFEPQEMLSQALFSAPPDQAQAILNDWRQRTTLPDTTDPSGRSFWIYNPNNGTWELDRYKDDADVGGVNMKVWQGAWSDAEKALSPEFPGDPPPSMDDVRRRAVELYKAYMNPPAEIVGGQQAPMGPGGGQVTFVDTQTMQQYTTTEDGWRQIQAADEAGQYRRTN